eukprot:GCRY01005933.1.p1 GENE.GCRY01005933.1~~GCRY01005933.1.p1  ORF type:complete len:290 (+),score=21.48 GCRY01005933.1:213-1082(+)
MMETQLCTDLSYGKEKLPIPCYGPAGLEVPTFAYCTQLSLPSINPSSLQSYLPTCYCSERDDTSCADFCECCLLNGNVATYDKNGCLIGLLLHHSSLPSLYECSVLCSCSRDLCRNRVVQQGPKHHFEVFYCGFKKGWGLRAHDFISKGSYIGEYVGELLRSAEADRKQLEYNKIAEVDPQFRNYLMSVKEVLADERVLCTHIDPILKGNFTRFMNHSCEPNCKRLLVRFDSLIPHISFFAVRDIKRGEELTFHYSDEQQNFERLDKAILSRCKCYCGASSCQGCLPVI